MRSLITHATVAQFPGTDDPEFGSPAIPAGCSLSVRGIFVLFKVISNEAAGRDSCGVPGLGSAPAVDMRLVMPLVEARLLDADPAKRAVAVHARAQPAHQEQEVRTPGFEVDAVHPGAAVLAPTSLVPVGRRIRTW
jgi:hypothetical protein